MKNQTLSTGLILLTLVFAGRLRSGMLWDADVGFRIIAMNLVARIDRAFNDKEVPSRF